MLPHLDLKVDIKYHLLFKKPPRDTSHYLRMTINLSDSIR